MIKKYLPDFRNISPVKQGTLIIVLITALSLGCLITRQNSMLAWNLISSPIFLFCFYNPILGSFHQKPLQYLGLSTAVFFVLLMYIYISGNFVSVHSYQQSQELHAMTLLTVLFYFMFQLICVLFKGILYMLEEIDR